MMIQQLSNSQEIEKCSLLEYLQEHPSEDEVREVFINMDIALKYIHEHNYCIDVFHPSKIEVLEGKPNHIQFDFLVELPKEPSKRKKYIQTDIFNSAFIQIAYYSHIGNYLQPDFLKEHFDEIAIFLPQEDVAYYRGVIERDANVYFSEYAFEKRNRDLMQLNQELGNNVKEKAMDEMFSNDKINDKIYKQINSDRAFINLLLIPTLLLFGFALFSILYWISSLS